jgi:hypothetical protein
MVTTESQKAQRKTISISVFSVSLWENTIFLGLIYGHNSVKHDYMNGLKEVL